MASTILSTALRDAYDLSFQISPIILNGGIAESVPGKMLPIIALVGQVAGFLQGAISSGSVGLNDFPIRYVPIPGGTVINNAIGTYPFANQQVAANAVIQQPTNISLMMIAPISNLGGYLTKLAIFTSLVTALTNHNNAGGTYTIATPSFIYTDCIMTGMTDVTTAETKQQQVQWQIDFTKPLISIQDAMIAFNGLVSKTASGGQMTSSDLSGANAGIGAPAQGAGGLAGMAGSVNNYMASPIL